MSEERNLIIGFDFSDDFTQISRYNEKSFEAESIGEIQGDDNYLIPTVLAVHETSKDWLYGDEALACVNRGEAILVDHLVNKVLEKKDIVVCDVRFSTITIVEKYFRKVLLLLKKHFPNENIKQLMVTIEKFDSYLIDTIYAALENMGILKDRVSIQSHGQSYIYYALSQKKELWMNDVGMFDFNEQGLQYYQISIDRRNHPMVVGLLCKDFTQTLCYNMLEECACDGTSMQGANFENIEYIFENITNHVLHKQIISTLYLTGNGFEGEWADRVIKELCIGRRIFKGMNLYTKGACYAAREVLNKGRFEDFIFISEEMVANEVTMKTYYDAKLNDVVLVNAAASWHEIDHKFDVILDDEKEIAFVVKNVLKRESKKLLFALDGLVTRPNKMTRLTIKVKCLDKHTCMITVKDKGFGEFYPSTNRIWEMVIQL